MTRGHYVFLVALLCYFANAFATNRISNGSGSWSTASTWSPAGVPAAGDNVTILAGHTITMNGNAGNCLSLSIYGTAKWTSARTTNVGAGGLFMSGGTISGTRTGTLNIAGDFTMSGTNNIARCNLTISGSTTVSSILNITSATGNKTFNNFIITNAGSFNNAANENITISGDLQNDGLFDIGSGNITFNGATSNTITGTALTAFDAITVNKGNSSANVLDVQAMITMTAGGLTLRNGTFKISSSSTLTPFTADITSSPYLIPVHACFWCNGATMNSGNMNWTVAGELRISAGTINMGNSADNRFRAVNGGTTLLTVEGGILNVAGRISRALDTDDLTFKMSGGIINVPTIGCTSPTFAPIQMDQPNSSFTMTGGTIILLKEGGSGTQHLGFVANAGTVGISGGIIQIGDASTPASQIIGVNSIFNIAKLSVNSSNATCQLQNNLSVLQSVTIHSGTLDANNFNLNIGGIWTNAGSFIPGTGTVLFNGTGTQNITKAGGETFYTLSINKPSGSVVLDNDVNINDSLIMTSGNIDCSSHLLTLGTSVSSPGGLSYTAGIIIGSLKRWINNTSVAYLFPIGTSSYYRPAQINFTNLSPGTLTASFISTDPGNNGLPLNESGFTIANQYTEGYWNLTAANSLTGNNYNIDLTGNGFTSYVVAPATRILYRALSNSPWSLNGVHVSGSGTTASRSGITGGLSAQFCLGKTNCSPYSAAAISGSATICSGTTGSTYSLTNTPGNIYTWSVTGGSIAAGQGTNAAQINWGATGMTGNVQVIETNSCNENNTPINLPVIINPIATSTIAGAQSVATNQTGVTYSVSNTPGYVYTWSFPSGGGSIANGQGTNSVDINWGAVSGTYTLQVNTTRACGVNDIQNLSVIVRSPIKSRTNGNWTNASTWIGGMVPTALDYVEISAGNTVTMNGNPGACYKLIIDGTANWTTTRTTNAGLGGVEINSTGNITGTTNGKLTTLGGITGNNNVNITSDNVSIIVQTTNGQNITSTGAFNKLTINANANNTGNITIANNGTLDGSATLTQGINSTLTINNSTFNLTNLDASATGNIVEYSANVSQNVRGIPYHHLTLSGTGIKTLSGDIQINGNLNIAAGTLDVSTSNYSITSAGNWTNAGSFNARFGTVTFNGGVTQTITNIAGETFNNLNMSSAGTKVLANNVTINFDFTLNSIVNAGSNHLYIRGNFDNSGTYNSISGNSVTFTNNTKILGSSPTTFRDVIIAGTLTAHYPNMNVTGNWTNNGTFIHNDGNITFNGTTTISGSSTSSFGSITVSGTLNASPSNINIAHNFTDNGIFNPNNGTITFNGTTAQIIGGTNIPSFFNVTQNNSTSVSLTQDVDLHNVLTISNGAFTTTGHHFKLKSDASNTARIAAIGSGADITGNIIMERYTGTGPTNWRELACPVNGATIADWADDFPTSGFTGSTDPGNSFVSIYWYDETKPGDQNNYGWTPATNITNPLVSGRGYYVYLGTNPITYSVTGPPEKFSKSLAVSYSNSGDINNDGWNLVSNSYPCAVDWDNSNWTKSGLDNAVYIYNASTSSYASYVNGIGVNGGSKYISSSQAFWVKANSASPVLTMAENVKASGNNPIFMKKKLILNTSSYPMAFKDFPVLQNTNNIPNSIRLTCSSSAGVDDETFIEFSPNGTTGFDKKYDAWKLLNTAPVHNFSSLLDDTTDLSINILPPLQSDVQIRLRLQVLAAGTYTIRRDSLLMLPLSSCIFLEDLATDSMIDLRQHLSYTFSISDTTKKPRFILHISAPIFKHTFTSTCKEDTNGKAVAKGTGTGPWDYTWKNDSDKVIKTSLHSFSADTLFNIASGIYTVEISGSECGIAMDTLHVPYLSNMQIIPASADVSCAGNNDGAVMVAVSGGSSIYSYLWSTNDITQQVNNLAPGNYSVTVTDSYGCIQHGSTDISSTPMLFADFTSLHSDTIVLSLDSSIAFINNSSGASLYQWDFGDGTATDTLPDPTHRYVFPGTYTVSLTASDSTCSSIAYRIINVFDSLNSGIHSYESPQDIGLFSHNNQVFISCNSTIEKGVDINIYNMLGMLILKKEFSSIHKGIIRIGILNSKPSFYLAEIKVNDRRIVRKFTLH